MTAIEKPDYAVPLMAEIAEIRGTNGLKVVSTFSGCGGSCLGFEMAGYEVLWASEFVEAARDVYERNHPGVHVDGRDIRNVMPEDILRDTGLEVGQLDVLEGSPPCSSFSTAGVRHKKWGTESDYSDTKQRTDDLFFEYARLLEGLQPRAFVAENVSGLVKGVAKGYFKMILKRLGECGYRVEASLLDAQWLGVPQARQRLIFMGVRNDLDKDPKFPAPFPYRYTVRDALPWLDSARAESNGPTGPDSGSYYWHNVEPKVVHDTSGDYGVGEVTDRPSPTITVGVNSVNSHHYQVHGGEPIIYDPETGYRLTLTDTAIGPEWDKLKEGEASPKFFNLKKASRDKPSQTVTQAAGGRGVAGVTHPIERRKFTLLELRRICAFPDDFELTGTYQQRWERLGRAVPPLMMREIAATVAEILK